MQQQLQITIKDIDNSPGIEQHIREKVEKLSQFFDEIIISCHVNVELSQKHKNIGKLHSVHIKLHTPGKEVVSTHKENENLWIAIRDAFDNIRDQLSNHIDFLRHHIKTHPDIIHGRVVRLFDDFGFILSSDGFTEYYFNSGNVASIKFDKLKVGTSVHFIEAVGADGMQAKRVTLSNHEHSINQ